MLKALTLLAALALGTALTQCAPPWPYLHQPIIRPRPDLGDNVFQHRRVVEEVLTESLATWREV